ncbi:MAG: division/cell wall cluster transcriptional repressor MraZ [Bacteroidetes bacterium]|jgi:MraZ protein|nr:division/cell wall cluster transcriptional repressor MraZ [Bacteroidota bacterium]
MFIFGEFECKADAKGRFLMPAALLKQLPEDERQSFVINRGLDDCLALYPEKVWQEELTKIYSQNQFVAENRTFARLFQAGAVPVSLDGSNRLLVPKKLAEHASIEKELVLIGSGNKIEIWSQARFEAQLQDHLPRLADISERVMGGTRPTPTPDA